MIDSFDKVFEYVVDFCKNKGMTEQALDLWIRKIEPVGLEENNVILSVSTSFQKDMITKHYVELLNEGFKEILGFDVVIQINVAGEASADTELISEEEEKDLQKSFEYAKYDYTFDTFIVGKSNDLAFAACKAVANGGGTGYNPLFIYGNSGLGKTHLMMATAAEMKEHDPNLNIMYVTGESFGNEVVNAIQYKSTSALHDKYRTADILLMDDVQFIAGKNTMQEEFFHTFNALYQDQKQIVLTADRPPKEIKTLEERIKTRFESGLIVDVQPPDFETRVAIINRKAELLDLKIPDEVSQFIANKIKSNIRQLEGAVKKLKAFSHHNGDQPTIPTAQTVIRDILTDEQPLPVTIERIITEVANVYGVSAEDIRSTKRNSQISTARKVAIYIVRQITGMSLQDIGKEFGNRDHSTIVYAVNNVTKNIRKDESLKDLINDIIKNIHAFSNGG